MCVEQHYVWGTNWRTKQTWSLLSQSGVFWWGWQRWSEVRKGFLGEWSGQHPAQFRAEGWMQVALSFFTCSSLNAEPNGRRGKVREKRRTRWMGGDEGARMDFKGLEGDWFLYELPVKEGEFGRMLSSSPRFPPLHHCQKILPWNQYWRIFQKEDKLLMTLKPSSIKHRNDKSSILPF